MATFEPLSNTDNNYERSYNQLAGSRNTSLASIGGGADAGMYQRNTYTPRDLSSYTPPSNPYNSTAPDTRSLTNLGGSRESAYSNPLSAASTRSFFPTQAEKKKKEVSTALNGPQAPAATTPSVTQAPTTQAPMMTAEDPYKDMQYPGSDDPYSILNQYKAFREQNTPKAAPAVEEPNQQTQMMDMLSQLLGQQNQAKPEPKYSNDIFGRRDARVDRMFDKDQRNRRPNPFGSPF